MQGLKELDVELSPVDGRYQSYTRKLSSFLSEAGLNRARINVEIEWVIALCDGLPATGFDEDGKPWVEGLPTLSGVQKSALRKIVDDFDLDSVARLAEHEATTKHDVKAVEYYIKDELLNLKNQGTFNENEYNKLFQAIHVFCTSEDINNLSYAISIRNAVEKIWIPALLDLIKVLEELAQENAQVPMLAKTHGQPATPTTLGKEIAVFIYRLRRQFDRLEQQEYLGKINGATGTFGAHFVSVETALWPRFAKWFVEERLHLTYNPLTTQIESHDWDAELFGTINHIDRILHNLATDVWMYISNDVFAQIPEEGATGSSTMPHKINPIKFENAEANLEIADALFSKLSETLVTSRMQRDLTDSTTQRNIGVAFGHSMIALGNLTAGLKALNVNKEHLLKELEENPAVLGEAVQTVMRVQGIKGGDGMENPYERLKKFSRGEAIDYAGMQKFINELTLEDDVKAKLLKLKPQDYIGLAPQLVEVVSEGVVS
ncbi:adenylosuccinate lyase [Actinomycetota bacterium]|nr:adenylosuccinate lyase [Actinomycetota bacterium]